jgi:hypothetical protein
VQFFLAFKPVYQVTIMRCQSVWIASFIFLSGGTTIGAELETRQALSLKDLAPAHVVVEFQTNNLNRPLNFDAELAGIVSGALTRLGIDSQATPSKATLVLQIATMPAGRELGVSLTKLSVRQASIAERDATIRYEAETWHQADLVVSSNQDVIERIRASTLKLVSVLERDFSLGGQGRLPVTTPISVPLTQDRLDRMAARLQSLLTSKLQALAPAGTTVSVRDTDIALSGSTLSVEFTVELTVAAVITATRTIQSTVSLPPSLAITDQEICAQIPIGANTVRVCVFLQDLI